MWLSPSWVDSNEQSRTRCEITGLQGWWSVTEWNSQSSPSFCFSQKPFLKNSVWEILLWSFLLMFWVTLPRHILSSLSSIEVKRDWVSSSIWEELQGFLVTWWWRICLLMQETQVWFLVWEDVGDPTCHTGQLSLCITTAEAWVP